MRRAEVAILGPPSLMVMLVPAGLAALFWVALVAVLVAAVSAVHLAGTATRDAGPRLDLALAGHHLVVQFGGQHADDGVQRLDACARVAAHAARLELLGVLHLSP